MMKAHLVRSFVVLALVAGLTIPALADTIRLKDGTVIRGQIISFKNEQFTILVGSGARGRKSRMTVFMEDVESIEFDNAAGNSGSQPDDTNNQTVNQPPINSRPANNEPTNGNSTYEPPNNDSSRSNSPTTNNQPAFFQVNVRVKGDNSANGWTNTGLVVRRGQHLKINASGRVSLGKDQRTGAPISSSADGLIRDDKDKLMRNQRTGALIGVIGDDNDDFIFIGSKSDFVAQRDGTLFLGVNEGNLSDNSGAFDVVIDAESMSGDSTYRPPATQPNNNQPVNSNSSYNPPASNPPSSSANPSFFQINVRVRADNTSNGWTNSGLVVRRGQRLRISASGRVSLGSNRFSTPDGVPGITDRDKLMRNQPTGGLIAVIGDDNDDFIFIGHGHDFVAQRDGVLFFGVNEGNLSDNTGAFDVVIDAEATGSR